MLSEIARYIRPGCLSVGLIATMSLSGPLTGQPAQEPQAAQSQAQAQSESVAMGALMTALGFDDLMPILQEEGLSYADGIRADMFADRPTQHWQAALDHIYDPARMSEVMQQELTERLDADRIAPLMAFFSSDLGERIVLLEVTAREAMLEPSVDDAARQRYAAMREAGGNRIDLLDRFVAANDLIEMNVAGALNSNYAFYQGLASGGTFRGMMSDDEIIAEVWGQEESMREETGEWVNAYLALAYQPLEDQELQAYIDFSLTDEGKALNTALFGAFDALFTAVSRDLGTAAARLMAGQDI